MTVTMGCKPAPAFIVFGPIDDTQQLLENDTSSDGLLQISTPVSNGTPIYTQVYCDDNTAVTQATSWM